MLTFSVQECILVIWVPPAAVAISPATHALSPHHHTCTLWHAHPPAMHTPTPNIYAPHHACPHTTHTSLCHTCHPAMHAPLPCMSPSPTHPSPCEQNDRCLWKCFKTIYYQGSQLTELCYDYEEFVAEVGADNVCVDLVYYSRPLKQDKITLLSHPTVEVKRQISHSSRARISWGCQLPTAVCQSIILQFFCQKMHENERIWNRGCPCRHPLDPPLLLLKHGQG